MASVVRQSVSVMAAFAAVICLHAENWPQFRGPRGDGTSAESIPETWALRWKVALPGPGHSSPIVWGDRVFLTAFERDRSILGALTGARGKLLVLCLDRINGKTRWQREVPADTIEKVSGVNQPASPTPATDGQSLFVYFGSFGLLVFDLDGNPRWQKKLGPFPHHMGTGSSPVSLHDRVLLNVETDGDSFLLAADKTSGRELWRVPRKTQQAGYSTPFVWEGMAVVSGHQLLTAYSLADGRELWIVPGLSDYVVPTPVAASGLLYVTSSGPGGSTVMAVRPNGKVAWHSTRGAAYVASPIYVAGRLFTINQGGILSCLDAASGKLIWQQRLAARGDYHASPVAAANAIYVVSESGELSAIAPAEAFRLIRTYSLGESVLASPAISAGTLLIRSSQSLFVFGDR